MKAIIRVLVVDDEPQIMRFLRPTLGANDFEVLEAKNGTEAIKLAASIAPDLIILDLGLPDMDGKDVIKALREWSQLPIIVLSARDREAEKIEALDLGADDFINKPFGVGELMARIRAALRHKLQQAGEPPVFRSYGLSVDLVRRLVQMNGQDVHLTPKEYELLRLLVQHAGKVLTHKQIMQAVWGPAHTEDTQYLRVYIGQLRQKIEINPDEPKLILNEPGIGYRLKFEAL